MRYGPRRPVATKLAAYTAIVEARLAAYPQLSAVRLLDEIRAAGYLPISRTGAMLFFQLMTRRYGRRRC